MPIDPITSINHTSKLTAPNGTNKSGRLESTFNDFGQMLNNVINDLSQKESAANESITGLAAGEDIELHQVMLSMQEADISFQLAMQVRNKLVEAYQEVMRMQV